MRAPHDWIVPDWPAPPRVRGLVTTRNGGVSLGPYASFNVGLRVGDDPQAVAANRAVLRRLLPHEPQWLKQVHGARVVTADEIGMAAAADASIAHQPGTVCVILVADCVPVMLCDRAGTVVGIAHAGWRGLSAGVVENTVQAMGVAPHELIAWLGPGIGPDAFEVGTDVRDAFFAAGPHAASAFAPCREGKWLADLFALARQRLARGGVNDVFGGGLCTFRNAARFFSHRRDKITGRMAALIWLDPKPG